jgi:hypothetical protein
VRPFAFLVGLLLIAVVLWDAFETVVLPRTVVRRLRLARLYFRATWNPWARVARTFGSDSGRERFLAIYGPLSLLGLLLVWALGLILGFAVLQWAAGSRLQTPAGEAAFLDDLYMSGTTFFTLGLGDVHPVAPVARFLTTAEAGMGFAFLAIVIAYFPVLYQSFSRREVRLTLLDAWAGSPPSAGEVVRRLAGANEMRALDPFLKDWEYWCSEVLESHISYPLLAFFRSQHQRQSWVSALTTVLDVSALVVVGIDGLPAWQARVTFAIARHAAVDLSQVLGATPDLSGDRLPAQDLELLRRHIEEAGLRPGRSADDDARFIELRRSYEPFVIGLGRLLMMPLPSWWRQRALRDNWQTSPRLDGGPHL